MVEYLCGVLTGIFVGAAGKYFGDKYTDQRKKLEQTNARSKAFKECEKEMLTLFDSIRIDLKNYPLAREFVVLSKHWGYNSDPHKNVFLYYFEDHEALKEKVKLLENNGFVQDIKRNNMERFQLTEEFVRLLQ